jgi:hypothetical protein
MTNPRDTAFPSLETEQTVQLGLTKREYFAARAMQGMLSDEGGPSRESYEAEGCAKRAVLFADALIHALSE